MGGFYFEVIMPPDRARFDVNNRNSLIAVSNVDGEAPVTLWADPTTHALITSGGGSGGSGGVIVDGVDGTIKATVFDFVDSNPIATALVDANGDQITSFGGDGTIVDGVDPTIKATVFDLGSSNPLATRLVDASGNPVDPLSAGEVVFIDSLSESSNSAISAINQTATISSNHDHTSSMFDISGTYTGDLTLQTLSGNGFTNWVSVTDARILNLSTGVYQSKIPSGEVGSYSVNINGAQGVRLIALGAVTGTATILIKTSTIITTPFMPRVGAGNTDNATQRVVIAANQAPILISGTISNDQVAGANITTTAPGVQLMSLAGPTGDPVDTIGTALSVAPINAPGILRSNGTLGSQDAGLTAGASRTIGFSVNSAAIIGPFDISAYSSITVQYTSVGSGVTINGQFSTDGANYTSSATWLRHDQQSNGPTTLGISTTGIFESHTIGTSFRINLSVLSSGTVTGTITLHTLSRFLHSVGVAGNVGSSTATGSAVPANAFYVAGINVSSNLSGLRVGDFGDGISGGNALLTAQWLYNGTNFDRARSGPTTGSALISAPTGTGSAVPANAFYLGGSDAADSTLKGVRLAAYNVGDAITAGIQGVVTYQPAFNGSTVDRVRNNTTGNLIATGTSTTQTNITLTTYNATKLVLLVNITAATVATLTVAISGVSTNYTYPILTSTALATVALTALRVFPGSTVTTNLAANDVVPRTISVTATVTGTIAYGIDYVLSV